jgi:hypothetical protein
MFTVSLLFISPLGDDGVAPLTSILNIIFASILSSAPLISYLCDLRDLCEL